MTPQRLWTVAAWLFTASTAAGACVLPFLRWQPRAGFDVLGILWLLTNVPNLGIWAVVITLLVTALYCWSRSLLAEAEV